jgi:hypothetical protein
LLFFLFFPFLGVVGCKKKTQVKNRGGGQKGSIRGAKPLLGGWVWAEQR